MSNNVVIRAEGLGKKYIIGHQAERERYTTLRDSVGRSLRNWGRSARDMFSGKALVAGDETEEFWALKDINFEIKRGDVVGIIGRNGAGKSTLLKVLSRITEPTTGRVTIDGRVASLLEVGTGFHPELSGRENIYLNGAILGMSREEIRRKFDEIVDFAGVEKFLDTPVKRYSSGMYVRLAFAVAAHLEPEILIVDEVLAVGDAEFQKKCLGKMKDVAGHGRTVLFVSHNMGAVRDLCPTALLFRAGELITRGMSEDVITDYLKPMGSLDEVDVLPTSGYALRSQWNETQSTSNQIFFDVDVQSDSRLAGCIEIIIGDSSGRPILLANTSSSAGGALIQFPLGKSNWIASIDFSDFATGHYTYFAQLSVPGVSLLAKEKKFDNFEHHFRPQYAAAPFDQSWQAGCVTRHMVTRLRSPDEFSGSVSLES
jgi:ABC-type polysaccharide/polyol phosphate transport system ATPase subunit